MDVDNWGLEAVVRGCSRSITATGASPFSDDRIDRWEITGFADPIESSFVLDDLEAIYKPFYPSEHPVTSLPLGIDPCSGPGLDRELTTRTTTSPVASVLESALLAMTKYQRRKNQQIRVVEHVTSEDMLSTDKWAWRKYGQKPVK